MSADKVLIFTVSFRNSTRKIKVTDLNGLFPRIEKQFSSCPGFGKIYRIQKMMCGVTFLLQMRSLMKGN